MAPMTITYATLSFAAREFAVLEARLQSFISNGQGNTDSANDVRELMAASWEDLSRKEQLLFDGLAEDYNRLRQGRIDFILMSSEQLSSFQEQLTKADDEVTRGELPLKWFQVLRGSLPGNDPRFQTDQARFMQGDLWHRIGAPEVGLDFIKVAATYNPEHLWLVLDYLRECGRAQEAITVAQTVIRKYAHNLRLVLSAGMTMLWSNPFRDPFDYRKDMIDLGPVVQSAYEAATRPHSPVNLRESEIHYLTLLNGHVHGFLQSIGSNSPEYDRVMKPTATQIFDFGKILAHAA